MAYSFTHEDFQFITGLLKEAGGIGLSIQKKGMKVQRKEDRTLVTQADLEIQGFLKESITRRFPGFHFIHEENQSENYRDNDSTSHLAIIDPVDGTAVYSMGLPTWSISVGFFEGYEPRYGFVYSPGCDMLFHNDDLVSYLNGEPVKVDHGMVIDSETNLFVTAELYQRFRIRFGGKVRNLGSTALHACLVVNNARNRTLAFMGKSYLWDWAGAIPVIIRAGGSLRYMSGREVDYREIMENSFKFPEYCIAYSACDINALRDMFELLRPEKGDDPDSE
jgi:fructose-1,6-bisphosphatase/inositol monophosphatase family enzyme